MASNKQIQLLGKRLRNGNYTESDLATLDEFRSNFDPLLIDTAKWACEALNSDGIRAVVAGRAKRTRSIIRKLQRKENRGMDLSRMADIVGLRVVVADQEVQDQAAVQIRQSPIFLRAVDYRPQGKPYRAVHIIGKDGPQLIEIQLRSLAQHVWANESESFGEFTKEGGGEPPVKQYLKQLSELCLQVDVGESVNDVWPDIPFMAARSPITAKLPRLTRLFNDATRTTSLLDGSNSFVVVYDNQVNRLAQIFKFSRGERQDAVSDYRRLCRQVDDVRFEVLIINSATAAAVRVSHPRFFPEV